MGKGGAAMAANIWGVKQKEGLLGRGRGQAGREKGQDGPAGVGAARNKHNDTRV